MSVRKPQRDSTTRDAPKPVAVPEVKSATKGAPVAAGEATDFESAGPDHSRLSFKGAQEAPPASRSDPLGVTIPASLLPNVPIGPVQVRLLSPAKQFLGILSVDVADSERLNQTLPLNPIKPTTPVFFRTRGVDAQNGMVTFKNEHGEATFVLREQARTPVLSRAERGLPGAHDFVLAESSGGSQFAEPKPEQVMANAHHELAEELHLDPALVRMKIIAEGVAISPDVSAGTFTAIASQTDTPLAFSDAEFQQAASGEIAETGARVLLDSPSEAVAKVLDGSIIDGRAAYLTLRRALEEQLPIDRKVLGAAPLPRGSNQRRIGVDDTYNTVTMTPRSEAGFRADGLETRGYDFTIATKNGSLEPKTDKFAHIVALRPDQVSELPVLRDASGQLKVGFRIKVGLVPTVSPGILARDGDTVKPLRVLDVAPTPALQLRGLVRDVSGYRDEDAPAARGNLRVAPEYAGNIADARTELAAMGLEATDRAWNAGQFTASVGENGFNMNLVTREYTGKPPQDSEKIRFVSLPKALELARTRPSEIDQMTQVQLYLLALREGVGFNLV